MTVIAHLDADCFYVSAERVRYNRLRHVPVGVLGNQGACVIAKSYEMQAAGVKTGMAIWDAVPLCPEGVFVKRDFRWYEVLSSRMLELLRTVSPSVEYYSIDEMFFDAGTLGPPAGLQKAGLALQNRMMREVGVPVSMGISHTKTLAKLASDVRKPFGVTTLLEWPEIEAFLSTQPVGDLCGVGTKSAAKLHAHGIKNCLQFRQADRKLIRDLLTIKGEGLWWELHGEAVSPIRTERPAHKILGRGGSVGVATADPARLRGWLARNVERLIEELDFHRLLVGRLALTLAFKAGGGASLSVPFPDATSDFAPLYAAGLTMLVAIGVGERLVSHMHLDAVELVPMSAKQLVLKFDDRSTSKRDDVAKLVNEKMGRFAVRSGETLEINDLYEDPAHGFEICDIRGKMCF